MQRHPLDASATTRPGVRIVREQIETVPRMPELVTRWTFTLPGEADPVVVVGRSDWKWQAQDEEERFGRQLAKRLGWKPLGPPSYAP